MRILGFFIVYAALLSLLTIKTVSGLSVDVDRATCARFGFQTTLTRREFLEGKYFSVVPRGDAIDPFLEGTYSLLTDDFSVDKLTAYRYYVFQRQLAPGTQSFRVTISVKDDTAVNDIRPSSSDGFARQVLTVEVDCPIGSETATVTRTVGATSTSSSQTTATSDVATPSTTTESNADTAANGGNGQWSSVTPVLSLAAIFLSLRVMGWLV